MNENIIAYLPPADHNVPDDPPALCVASCPRCTACVGWREPTVICLECVGWREPTVICLECGMAWDLTPAQADEFTLALLGLNNLRIDLFLAAIDREGGGLPPSVAYPALQPTWHSTGRFPSLVLADAAACDRGDGVVGLLGAAT